MTHIEPTRSVAEYRAFVSRLMREHSRDEAMSLAVGGHFDAAGDAEMRVLMAAGLEQSHSLVDLGCGSGRLANALVRSYPVRQYVGVDVVPALIDFAREQTCDSRFQFRLGDGASIAAPAASADMVAAFSLFTHLRPRERQAYLREIGRVLRPRGALVLSFLEPWRHRRVLLQTIAMRLRGTLAHHNAFAFRSAVWRWGDAFGLRPETLQPGAIGQSVAIFRKL